MNDVIDDSGEVVDIWAKDNRGERFLFDYRVIEPGTCATDNLIWQICDDAIRQGFTDIEVIYS